MVTVADFHKAFLEAEEDIKFAELSIGSLASIENSDCEPASNTDIPPVLSDVLCR